MKKFDNSIFHFWTIKFDETWHIFRIFWFFDYVITQRLTKPFVHSFPKKILVKMFVLIRYYSCYYQIWLKNQPSSLTFSWQISMPFVKKIFLSYLEEKAKKLLSETVFCFINCISFMNIWIFFRKIINDFMLNRTSPWLLENASIKERKKTSKWNLRAFLAFFVVFELIVGSEVIYIPLENGKTSRSNLIFSYSPLYILLSRVEVIILPPYPSHIALKPLFFSE